jgi:hypothetical protein
MVHHAAMPRAERLEIDGERRQRLSAGCFLEKVADEIDPSHVLIGVRFIMKSKAFYKASRADSYRKNRKADEIGSTVAPCTTRRSIACREAMGKENEVRNDVNLDWD